MRLIMAGRSGVIPERWPTPPHRCLTPCSARRGRARLKVSDTSSNCGAVGGHSRTLAQATAQVSDTLQRASWSGAADGVRHLFELRRGRGTFTDARPGDAFLNLIPAQLNQVHHIHELRAVAGLRETLESDSESESGSVVGRGTS